MVGSFTASSYTFLFRFKVRSQQNFIERKTAPSPFQMSACTLQNLKILQPSLSLALISSACIPTSVQKALCAALASALDRRPSHRLSPCACAFSSRRFSPTILSANLFTHWTHAEGAISLYTQQFHYTAYTLLLNHKTYGEFVPNCLSSPLTILLSSQYHHSL